MTTLTIDGPAGAGKSTVGRAVARALGWTYLDTGAMYRAVALAALTRGVDVTEGDGLGRMAASLSLSLDDDRVLLDGVDVTERIRADDVTRAVSRVSAYPEVRAALLAQQRGLAEHGRVVIEGRDIGTTVVPDAEVKVFLTASLDARAKRRAHDMAHGGSEPSLETVATMLEARDATDASRTASPLAKPRDALLIDSTALTFDEVVDRIVGLVRQRIHER